MNRIDLRELDPGAVADGSYLVNVVGDVMELEEYVPPTGGGGGGGSGSGYTLLSETVLASSTASVSLTLPADPGENLRIEVTNVRTDRGSSADNIILSLNGDTNDANYAMQSLIGTSSSVQASSSASRAIGTVPSSTATANRVGAVVADVWGIKDTTTHCVAGSRSFDGANSRIEERMVVWKNTAAITSVAVASLFSTMQAGTVIRIYGWYPS